MGFKDFCGLGKRIDFKIKQPLDHVNELVGKGGAQVIYMEIRWKISNKIKSNMLLKY